MRAADQAARASSAPTTTCAPSGACASKRAGLEPLVHVDRETGQRAAQQHEQPADVRGRQARDPGVERRRVEGVSDRRRPPHRRAAAGSSREPRLPRTSRSSRRRPRRARGRSAPASAKSTVSSSGVTSSRRPCACRSSRRCSRPVSRTSIGQERRARGSVRGEDSSQYLAGRQRVRRPARRRSPGDAPSPSTSGSLNRSSTRSRS